MKNVLCVGISFPKNLKISTFTVVQHYKTHIHRELINEILDDKYDELRDLVLHMYSLYTKLVLEISKDVKKDRKARLS